MEITTACHKKDAAHLQRFLARPDQVSAEYGKFLEDLQRELQKTSPANNEGPLLETLNTLSLAGWLTAKPVVFAYCKLIRDWVKEETPQKMADLKKMIEDVSNFCALVTLMSTMAV